MTLRSGSRPGSDSQCVISPDSLFTAAAAAAAAAGASEAYPVDEYYNPPR